MYQSHPSRDSIFTRIPQNLVEATQNIQPIQFEDLVEMHDLIWELADFAAGWQPDLIPFFATGGIPYLFPMMRVLDKQGQRKLTDGNHFHMFPGLSWSGDVEGDSAESFFASSFGELIRSNVGNDPVRILVIDTTNTGNAVNKAITACQSALQASEVASDSIALRIIGIVNTSHHESQQASKKKSEVTGPIRCAYVITPSGSQFRGELRDREFIETTITDQESEFSLELSYWLAGNVPTEDNAELIGVEAIHEELTTSSRARSGRFKIAYSNGEVQQGTGLSHLPGRLISMLAMPLDALHWHKMRQIDALPPQTEAEREVSAESKEISDGFLRLFELSHTPMADAIEGLKAINRPLMDVEVYWLGTVDPPPQDIARKVCDSLEKGCCTSAEAIKYFARAFPELVPTAPSVGLESWWTEQIRALPKDSLTSYRQPMCDATGECEASEDREDDDDFVLDFVVIVGGVESCRELLNEQHAQGWTMQQIKEHLDETWPITSDKALTFHGPSNEQVALDFVLNCGGWEQAYACLDDWIAKNSGSS